MTTEELTKAVIENKYKTAKQIAEEKFGEENVEFKIREELYVHSLFQYYTEVDRSYNKTVIYIIIHFPQKTVVSNETRQSHVIKDVYCKVCMKRDNTFCLKTARSTYTMSEIISGYTHSHVSGISMSRDPWRNTCLGSHSPLKTMSENGINDDLDWINLFNEIDRFYEVESIIGVPYIRIEKISEYVATSENRYSSISYYQDIISELDFSFNDFAHYMAKDILKTPNAISVSNGVITLNETPYNFKVRVNNALVKYINASDSPEDRYKIFEPFLEKNIKDRNGRYISIANKSHIDITPQCLFTFKGNLINRIVIPDTRVNMTLMPNREFVVYIYMKLLIMFNYERYRNPNETVKVIL